MRIWLWLAIWTSLTLGLHGAEWRSVTLAGRYQGNGWHLSGSGPCRYDFGRGAIVETDGDAALEISFSRHGKGVGFRLAGWWFCEVGESDAVPSPLVPSPGFGTVAWLKRQPAHMAVGKWYLLRGVDGFVLLRVREFKILEYARVREGWFRTQTYARCTMAFDYLAPGPMPWLSLEQASATTAVAEAALPATEARLVGSPPIAAPAADVPVSEAAEARLVASATVAGLAAEDRRAANREYGVCALQYAAFRRLGPQGTAVSGAQVMASALAVLQMAPDHEAFLRGEIARREGQLAGAAQAYVAAEGWWARRQAKAHLAALEAALTADRRALALWCERRLELARIVAELQPVAGIGVGAAGGEG